MDNAKHLAESIRELKLKLNVISDVTGWEIYETFDMVDRFDDLFYDMVGAAYCDWNYDKFREYVLGKIEYDELLEVLAYVKQ